MTPSGGHTKYCQTKYCQGRPTGCIHIFPCEDFTNPETSSCPLVPRYEKKTTQFLWVVAGGH